MGISLVVVSSLIFGMGYIQSCSIELNNTLGWFSDGLWGELTVVWWTFEFESPKGSD